MPQFDPTTFSPQIVWLIISFAILYWFMARIALPRISDVLDTRQERISGDLERAEELKSQAQSLADAHDQAIAKARAQAQEVVREARERMGEEATRRQAEVSERLGSQIAEAEARILRGKEEALSNLWVVVAEVAQSAAERLVGEAPSDELVGGAVDAAMRERRS